MIKQIKCISAKTRWVFDYYIAIFLYHPSKVEDYYAYMHQRWPFLCVELERELDSQTMSERVVMGESKHDTLLKIHSSN